MHVYLSASDIKLLECDRKRNQPVAGACTKKWRVLCSQTSDRFLFEFHLQLRYKSVQLTIWHLLLCSKRHPGSRHASRQSIELLQYKPISFILPIRVVHYSAGDNLRETMQRIPNSCHLCKSSRTYFCTALVIYPYAFGC